MSFAGRGRGFGGGGAGRGSFGTSAPATNANSGGFGGFNSANVAPALEDEVWDDTPTTKPATGSNFGGGDSVNGGFGSNDGFGSSNGGGFKSSSGFGSSNDGGFKSSGGFGSNDGFGSSNDGGFKSSGGFGSNGGFGSSAGGGGGRGGSRGGGPRTCHKCGEEGHMARECPQGGGGGGGPRTCHKCGEEGHMARECPQGGGGGGGPRTCHKCGEEGHMARECPQGGGGGGGPRTCHKCGEEGHMARECPQGGGGGGPRTCFKCHQEGHISRDCPNGGGAGGFGEMNSGGGFGDSGGFGGGSSGGVSRGGGSAGGGGGSGCRNCGEDGHFARECPNPRNAEDGRPPPENYIPPDEDEEYQSVQAGINFDKYDEIPVELTGSNPTRPIQSFAEAGLLETIEANVRKAKYLKPTPIQKYAVPAIMAGRDLMGCAQTGSGKTAAFLLPALTGMIQKGLEGGSMSPIQEPQALVVAPTRELVIQIYNECRKFSNGTIVRCVRLYGGTSTMHQSSDLAKGANIVVATPGRLLDFIGRQKIGLGKIQYLILDEADRMLDMGFEPEMRRLIETMGMPPKTSRQTLMFSATFPTEIQKLAGDFLNDYLFLTVGVVGGANQDVTQTVIEVTQYEKREKLIEILRENPNRRSLVFVELKRNADFLASMLSQSELSTTSIHGDRLQREREQALHDFKYGRAPILVATSVAARGLDIPGVDQVINYDLPKEIDEYVHRIGRTGRAGNLGTAISFFDAENNGDMARHLVRCLSAAHQEVPEFLERAASGGMSAGGGGGRFGGRDNRSRGRYGDNGGGDNGAWDERPGGVAAPDEEAEWD